MKYTKEQLNQLFINSIANEMKIDPSSIDIHEEFFALGIDSISAIYVLEQIENELKIEIHTIDFWDYPTIDQFSQYLIDKRL